MSDFKASGEDRITNDTEAAITPPAAMVSPGVESTPTAPGKLTLVFDTETTGLPLWHRPSDDPEQPRIVEIAALLCDETGAVVESYETLVNPGVPIPPDVTAIHGITDEMVQADGVEPRVALNEVLAMLSNAGEVAGHEVSFDLRMLRIEAARHLGFKFENTRPKFDTSWETAKALKIKKPKLSVAYEACFGDMFKDAHRAMPDAQASRRIVYHLKALQAAQEVPPVAAAVIGHNQPPEEIEETGKPIEEITAEDQAHLEGGAELTPFEMIKIQITDLHGEAKLWLDGGKIDDQLVANGVATLVDQLRKAKKRAEEEKGIEKRPHLDANTEIEARYKPIVALAERAIATSLAAQGDFLKRQQAEARRLADIATARAAEEAKAAVVEVRESVADGDLDRRERAEDMISQAQDSLKEAKMLAGVKSAAKPETGGRAIGLRTIKIVTIEDSTELMRGMWLQPDRRAELEEFMLGQAQKDVRAGATFVRGCKITDEQVAR